MSAAPPQTHSPVRRIGIQSTLIALTLVLLAVHAQPDHNLRVIFLATKGDAALIQTPSGGYILVDGGSDPSALTTALGRQIPFWRRNLDAVVLTADGGEQLPGQIAALARYQTKFAIAPPITRRNPLLNEWQRLLAEQGSRIHNARTGERIGIGGVTLQVMAIGTGDSDTLLLRLDYGATSVVFANSYNDSDTAIELSRLRPANLLVFPWQRDPHTDLVVTLAPQAIVLSDGQKADQPIEQTFVERAVGGAALYHERLDGTIVWVSDGRRTWMEREN